MARDRKGVFRCTWLRCGKSFKRNSDLARHYRIHTQERPYRCLVTGCSKGFIQRSALTVHSRTHTGERPHVCNQDDCHKAFADSSSLARHRRVHTGIRPYECQEDLCCRRFCRKTTLEKHQRRSHPKRSLSPSPPEKRTMEKHHTEPRRPSTSNEMSLLWQLSYDQAIAPNLGSIAQHDLQSIYLWGQAMPPPMTIWTSPAMQFFDMQGT